MQVQELGGWRGEGDRKKVTGSTEGRVWWAGGLLSPGPRSLLSTPLPCAPLGRCEARSLLPGGPSTRRDGGGAGRVRVARPQVPKGPSARHV